VLVTVLTIFYYTGTAIGGSSANPLILFNKIILLAGLTALVPYAFCAMSELILFIKNRAEFSGKRLFGSSVMNLKWT
jgi:basic amino acid/polyamine antiporter, APA family